MTATSTHEAEVWGTEGNGVLASLPPRGSETAFISAKSYQRVDGHQAWCLGWSKSYEDVVSVEESVIEV